MMKPFKSAALSTTMLAALVCMPAALYPAAASAQDAVNPVPTEEDTGEIVVTARKRAEDVLKTPVSVSVLSADAIAAKGIFSVNDISQQTPGLNINNASSGRSDRSFQQISLRGFTPSTATSTLTATFIDGVPVASATALNTIVDPARIEILKGPQSAYFGRNTFAGAINVVNKIPGNALSGTLTGSWGTRDNKDFTGAVEGAIIPDRIMLRVAGRYFSKDGSYANKANPGQTLGDQETYSGNALLVLKPTDRLTIKGFGLYSENHDGPSAQGTVSAYELRSNNGTVNIPALSGNTAGNVILAGQSNCTLSGFTAGIASTEARVSRPFICGAVPGLASTSPAQNTNPPGAILAAALNNPAYRFISPSDGVQNYGLKSAYYHLHLNVDYELGETGIVLSSLTGLNNEYYSELADLDNYDTSQIRNTANPTGAITTRTTYYDFPYLVERSTKDFSQEFRASYDKGALKAVLGVSYLHTRSVNDLINVSNVIVFGIAPASNSLSAPQKSITKGVFGGVTYELGKLSLSAEGRYQEDEIFAYTGGNATGLTLSSTNPYGLPAGFYAPLTIITSKTFKNFLPRGIVQYNFDRDLMAYASYSRGANVSLSSFNANFLNGTAAAVAAAQSIGLGVIVKPETLDNYEIGAKGRFFDGKLRLSLAGYYAVWNNQMNNRSINYIEPSTGAIAIVTGVANSGRSIVSGVEADAQILPFRGLSIDIGAAYNNTDIRSFTDPSVSKLTGVIGDAFIGNQLPGTSKYSGNLGVQYGSKIGSRDDTAFFVRADTSYKSRQFVDAANRTFIKARTQVNFRAGFSKGPASIEAYLTNAFNDKNYYSIANNSLLTPNFALASTYSYLTLGLPELRTFGLKAAYKF